MSDNVGMNVPASQQSVDMRRAYRIRKWCAVPPFSKCKCNTSARVVG